MKETQAAWIVKSFNTVASDSKTVKDAFRKTEILKAIDAE
jgi:hypothetical protein